MRRRGSRAREARELVDPRARRVDGAGADGPRVRGRHAGRQHLLGPHVVVAGREALLRLADDRDDGVRRRARRRHGQERVAREHDVAVARRRTRREPVDLALLHPRLHGRRERARRPRRGRQADGAGPLGDVDELVAAAEFAHGVRQRRARGLGHAQHEHGAGPSPRAAVERVDGAADGLAQRGRRRFHAGLLVVERAHERHADEDEQSEAPARDEELRRRAARRARRADLLRVRRQALAFARDATHRAVKLEWFGHSSGSSVFPRVQESMIDKCKRAKDVPFVDLRPRKVASVGALDVCSRVIRREEQKNNEVQPVSR